MICIGSVHKWHQRSRGERGCKTSKKMILKPRKLLTWGDEGAKNKQKMLTSFMCNPYIANSLYGLVHLYRIVYCTQNRIYFEKLASFRQILTNFGSENNFEIRKGYRIRFIQKIQFSEKKISCTTLIHDHHKKVERSPSVRL